MFGRDDPPPLRLEEAKLQGGCFWGKEEEQAAEVVWKRMPVNINVEEVRSEIMHGGRENAGYSYTIGGRELEVTKVEKDMWG